MPYRLSLATADERALVVEAMRAAAGTRSRAAAKAAATTMEAKRAGVDVRARAVKLVAMLAEAADLERLAVELELVDDLPLVIATGTGAAVIPVAKLRAMLTGAAPTEAELAQPLTAPELDAAHRLAEVERVAELAGLTVTPELEDALTGALPEDEPADVADVLTPADLGHLDPAYAP